MLLAETIPDDGYIKYRAEHKQIDDFDFAPEYAEQISELLKTRDYLRTKGLVGVYPNGIGFGNCSFKRIIRCDLNKKEQKEDLQFIITGSATGEIENLRKNHLCLVENFDIVKNQVFSKGSIQASSESMTHGAIYSANSKINSVLHIHSRKIFDQLKQTAEAKGFKGATPTGKPIFTAANIPYGTPEMAFSVMEEIKKIGKANGIIVMLGHDEGVISFGETIVSALAEIEKVL